MCEDFVDGVGVSDCCDEAQAPAAPRAGEDIDVEGSPHQVRPGPVAGARDIVLMNAAAILVAGGKAKDFKEGVALASDSLDSGSARAKLDALVELSQRLSEEK